jgi:hypothetical protein
MSLLASPAVAAPPSGLGQVFRFQDWYVACDNTRHCEAQGYNTEQSDQLPVALIIRRDAGGSGASEFRIRVGDFPTDDREDASPSPDPQAPAMLQVGGLHLPLHHPTVNLPTAGLPAAPSPTEDADDYLLSSDQVRRLIPMFRSLDHLTLESSHQTWTISLLGARAALLKMDDLQGRVGTTTAWVRTGPKGASEVPRSAVIPTLRPQPTMPNHGDDAQWAQRVQNALQALVHEDCPLLDDAEVQPEGVWRLDEHRLMVVLPCLRGAYQGWSSAWMVRDDTLPIKPVPVIFSDIPGTPPSEQHGATSLFIERTKQGWLVASSAAKGRGLGDCWDTREWVWTGQKFELTAASESVCRAFTAGGLPFTLWQADTRGAN